MIEPGVIKLVEQDEGVADCAIACLAMMLGVSYGEVWLAVPRTVREKNIGMTDRHIRNAAKKLGAVVRCRNTPPEDDEFGMLYLSRPRKDSHVALHLRGGTVIDPSEVNVVYTDVETFCKVKGWKVRGFYWREA